MSADRTDRNATGAIATREAENIQSPPPENNLTRMVVDVFAATARLGAVGGDPFEAAVRAYVSCNSDIPHDEAARAVAGIICHRW